MLMYCIASNTKSKLEDKVVEGETNSLATDSNSEDEESTDNGTHDDNKSEGEEVVSVLVEGQSGSKSLISYLLTCLLMQNIL